MQITFRGAARTVTGSMHEIQTGSRRFLLDCGMFQGRRRETEAKNRAFPIRPGSIDAMVLSHAHIDHSGRIPLLVKQGFRGPVHTTSATSIGMGASARKTPVAVATPFPPPLPRRKIGLT